MSVDFDVVELDEPEHPAVGETAPDFTRPLVTDEFWADASLSELQSPILLVFYPMDGSFPATYIWNELRDREIDQYGTVVGVSISTPYAHKRFIESHDLDTTSFRLFSDPSNKIADMYGVSHELDGMSGLSEPRPAVFVIGDSLSIEYAWTATEWPEFPEYDAVENAFAEAGTD